MGCMRGAMGCGGEAEGCTVDMEEAGAEGTGGTECRRGMREGVEDFDRGDCVTVPAGEEGRSADVMPDLSAVAEVMEPASGPFVTGVTADRESPS